jgi:hypothetical protein
MMKDMRAPMMYWCKVNPNIGVPHQTGETHVALSRPRSRRAAEQRD